MSPVRRSNGDTDESFAEAFRDADVEPLTDRQERVVAQTAGRGPATQGPAHFDFPDPGELGLGIASGIQTSQLRRLRAGRIRPERRIDLHGLRGDAARRALLDALVGVINAGERCVLVIHGKGLRSESEPVLRR